MQQAAASDVRYTHQEHPGFYCRVGAACAPASGSCCASAFSIEHAEAAGARVLLQDDLQQLRTAYDAFLAQYPLCYGYWKKYAEAELRHGSSTEADAAAGAAAAAGSSGGREAAAAVYRRAVAAVPHSTELWVAYAALMQSSDAPTDTVRRCG